MWLHSSVGPCMLCAPSALSSLSVLCLHAHPSQSTIRLWTKLHINIHYPHTISLPSINYISFKTISFICWPLVTDIFTYNWHVNDYCNCIWGRDLHRKVHVHVALQLIGYKRKQENKVKLTYHCSFIHKWILACHLLHLHCQYPSVCSVCMPIHHGPPLAF